MYKATISELKNHLSAYLKKVQAGETVLVFDRNRPIARIERAGGVHEGGRAELLAVLRADGGLLVWWSTPVECASAIARREREGDLAVAASNAALARLRALEPSWIEVSPTLKLRRLALRLLRAHAPPPPHSLP